MEIPPTLPMAAGDWYDHCVRRTGVCALSWERHGETLLRQRGVDRH